MDLKKFDNYVFFQSVDWNHNWERQHEFCYLFGKLVKKQIQVVHPLGMINHNPVKILQKYINSRNSIKKESGTNKKLDWMSFINPTYIPYHYNGLIDQINFSLIRKVMPINFTKHKNFVWANYVNGIVFEFFKKSDYKVLDIWTRRQINDSLPMRAKDLEKKAIEIADLVIIDSKNTYNDYKGINKNMILVPHGVDVNRFEQSKPAPELLELKKQSKIVGYCGALHQFIDYDILENVINSMEDLSFVFVGNIIDSRANRLRSFPNAILTGRKSYEELGSYYKAFDIGLIPYKINRKTSGIVPTKFFEYLANGIPVISSRLEDLNEHSNEFIKFYSSDLDFIRQIKDLLKNATPARQAAIINFSKKHTWEKRFSTILSHL